MTPDYDFSKVYCLPKEENEMERFWYKPRQPTGHLHPSLGWDDPMDGRTHLGPGASEDLAAEVLSHETLHGVLHQLTSSMDVSMRLHRVRGGDRL